MLKINVIGSITFGPNKGQYILIKPAGEQDPNNPTEDDYYLYWSQNTDFTGGVRNGVYNDYLRNLANLKSHLQNLGVIEDDVVHIAWLG